MFWLLLRGFKVNLAIVGDIEAVMVLTLIFLKERALYQACDVAAHPWTPKDYEVQEEMHRRPRQSQTSASPKILGFQGPLG